MLKERKGERERKRGNRMQLLITAEAKAAKPVSCVSVRMCLYVSGFLFLSLLLASRSFLSFAFNTQHTQGNGESKSCNAM